MLFTVEQNVIDVVITSSPGPISKHFYKNPDEFADAVDTDVKVRNLGRDKEAKLFIHKTCKPLSEVKFNTEEDQLDMFDNACEGMCGV